MANFHTCVQAVPERLAVVQLYRREFPELRIHMDTKRTGAYNSFGEMLNLPGEGWRMHLQDDCELAPGLGDYVPKVIAHAELNGYDAVSFFCMRRKLPDETYGQYVYDKDWVEDYRIFHILGVLFSPRMMECLRESYWEVFAMDDKDPKIVKNHDDLAVMRVIDKHGLVAMNHYPNLVQHRHYMKSASGHKITSFSRSGIYDPNYLS